MANFELLDTSIAALTVLRVDQVEDFGIEKGFEFGLNQEDFGLVRITENLILTETASEAVVVDLAYEAYVKIDNTSPDLDLDTMEPTLRKEILSTIDHKLNVFGNILLKEIYGEEILSDDDFEMN